MEVPRQQACNWIAALRIEIYWCLWMQVDTMEKIAQGRVWTGKDAASRDLLATITGFSRSFCSARQSAKIHQNRKVTCVQMARNRMASNPENTNINNINSCVGGLRVTRLAKKIAMEGTGSQFQPSNKKRVMLGDLSNNVVAQKTTPKKVIKKESSPTPLVKNVLLNKTKST
ncbi:hypothetical protein Tco_1081597 [Tanacetum coccineum]|uniref:Uncharacterized protein n=1 Tax=Tanacetum coccineum TaxID=301880 RepID=A0ABQ5I039_9ASTR